MSKPPVFVSIWTNMPPDPDMPERWHEWVSNRRAKSPADIEAARAYANEFSQFAWFIARTMRSNKGPWTFRIRKTKAVVSRITHAWWKAEFYRPKTEIERCRTSAIFEPEAFDLPAATERQDNLDELAALLSKYNSLRDGGVSALF